VEPAGGRGPRQRSTQLIGDSVTAELTVPPKGAKGVIITQGGSVGGDWTQSKNIAAQNSAKLAELQRLWLMEAVKYNVAAGRPRV
jgi:hypothetical protein